MIPADAGAQPGPVDRLLVEALQGFSDAIVVCDAQDRVVFANDRYHQLFHIFPGPVEIRGMSYEQLIRLTLRSGLLNDPTALLDPDGYVARRRLERSRLAGRVLSEQLIGGRWYRRVEERISTGAIVNTFADITDRKLAEAARESAKAEAERTAARLAAAVEAIPGGFMMMDEDLNYLVWNSRYPVIGGATDEIIRAHANVRNTLAYQARRGDYDNLRIDPDRFAPGVADACPCLAALIRCQSDRPPDVRPGEEEMAAMVEWQLLRFAPGGRPDGETGETVGTFTVADTGAVVEFRRRRIPGIGWVSLYTDITDRVRQAAEVQAARAAAETALEDLKAAQDTLIQQEKLAGLGGLVAGLAHELNTPVGIAYTAANHLKAEVAGFRARLDDGRLKRSELTEFVDMVAESATLVEVNAGRASRLVQSFKTVSSDQVADDRRTFELKLYLEEVILSLAPRWRRQGHEIVLTCPGDLAMDSFPGALSQVFTNLIVNSTVHAFPEGQAGRIDIAVVRPMPDQIIITYRDDGVGIPLSDVSRIFDPFFTTRRGAGSTGLGLHIVYSLMTKVLGGRISVWSAPGQGTRFTLHLPRVAPQPAAG